MARVRLSGPAQTDLAAILATSFERWGENGRARYASMLAAAIRAVLAHPDGPTTRDRAELLPGIRSFHLRHTPGEHGVGSPVHVLYYRATRPGVVEVVRVLHERMEPSRHVTAGVPRPSRVPRRRGK